LERSCETESWQVDRLNKEVDIGSPLDVEVKVKRIQEILVIWGIV